MIKKIALWVFFSVVATSLVHHLFFFRQGLLENACASVAKPFLVIASAINSKISTHRENKKIYAQIKSERDTLKKNYDDLFTAYVNLRATSKFNEHIQELVDFKQRYNFDQAILAKVLTKSINASEHTAILNRGSAHGVRNDMVAIYKLQIIGRVYECYPTMCKIILLTDKRCKVAGFTNSTSAGGIVTGSNESQKCSMMFVSHLSEIVDEDFIFSSGQGLIFPEGFCLGKIIEHHHDKNNLYHTINVEPLVDFQELQHCLLASQDMINLF